VTQDEFNFDYNGSLTDWERFKSIHKERPKIYEVFQKVTFELMKRGYDRYSAYGIMHIVRFKIWQPGVDMRPDEDYKISNNMTPFYARLFLRDFPEHQDNPDEGIKGFFQTKVKRLEGFREEWIEEI